MKLLCPECNNEFSNYSLSAHMHRVHGLKYSVRTKKCMFCGNQTMNHKFCNRFCAARYNAPNRSYESRIRKSNRISPELSDRIIKMHVEDGMTVKDISNLLNTSTCFVRKQFYNRNISVHNAKNSIAGKKKYDAKIQAFIDSDLGKDVLEKYSKKGGTLRGLHQEYSLDRRFLKNVLTHSGASIKNNRDARNEVGRLTGEKHPMHGRGRPPGSGKCGWYLYNGVKYQGSWEFMVGLWLAKHNIEFICHKGVEQFKYRMAGHIHTYCPDFYVPVWDRYIEVKGYFSEKDKEKMTVIKDTYPNLNIEVFDKKVLKEKNILSIGKELGIDIERYRLNYLTGNSYYDDIVEKYGADPIIDSLLLDKTSWSKKACEIGVPVRVLSSFIKKIMPKIGSPDFYRFLFNRYIKGRYDEYALMNEKSIKRVSINLSKINGIKFRRNFMAVKQIRDDAAAAQLSNSIMDRMAA